PFSINETDYIIASGLHSHRSLTPFKDRRTVPLNLKKWKRGTVPLKQGDIMGLQEVKLELT
ncbi:MAG: hypothetical protein ACE5L7_08780, partial [Candidatus Aminicenantales bacterium]